MTKIFRKNLKSAFTLAEVLITLTIIGVIAAIVIPNLMQRHFEQEMISKLKKNYSVLNNAFAQAVRENGTVDEWGLPEDKRVAAAIKIFTYISPYLKIQKDCGQSGGCLAESYKALHTNETPYYIEKLQKGYQFILEDGSAISIIGQNTGAPYPPPYAHIFIDLNGVKGPNIFGWDTFWLDIMTDTIMPRGLATFYTNSTRGLGECNYPNKNGDKYNGSTCAVHVLYKGNMDYLHRDIKDDWKNWQN